MMKSERCPAAFTDEAAIEGPGCLLEDDECRIISYENDMICEEQPQEEEEQNAVDPGPHGALPARSALIGVCLVDAHATDSRARL